MKKIMLFLISITLLLSACSNNGISGTTTTTSVEPSLRNFGMVITRLLLGVFGSVITSLPLIR